jgi:hypothetical protein
MHMRNCFLFYFKHTLNIYTFKMHAARYHFIFNLCIPVIIVFKFYPMQKRIHFIVFYEYA